MTTENSESNAIEVTEDLDAFSNDFFGSANPENDAAVENGNEDADDTSIGEEDTAATNEEDTPEEDEGDSNEPESEEEKPAEKPRKKSAQERISELTAARREAERQAKAWEERFNELLKKGSPGEKEEEPKTPAAANDTGAPDPDEKLEDGSLKYPLGEYDPAYVRDNARFILKQEMDAIRAEQEQEEARRKVVDARTELTTAWENKLQEAESSEEMADIREVGLNLVESFSDLDPEYGDFLATTIMGLEMGPEVFYHLATNLDEAREIADAGGIAATIALGALQERIRAGKEPKDGINVKKPKVSKAPEPPKNFNRGSSGRFEVPDDTDDLEAFSEKFFASKRR